MCLKGLIAVAFESSEPLYLVSVPSLHRESTDSLILPAASLRSRAVLVLQLGLYSRYCGHFRARIAWPTGVCLLRICDRRCSVLASV